MPSSTPQQAKVMSAIAHGWHPTGKAARIPLKVAKEFHAADAGHKYGKGMASGGDVVPFEGKISGPTFRRREGPSIPLTPENIDRAYSPHLKVPIIPSVNQGPFIGVPKLAFGGRPMKMRPPNMRMPLGPIAPLQMPMRTPYTNRMGFAHMEKGGFINSKVPGRTDKHYVTVHEGSYVLPADHVSALGQNNSNAGAEVVRKMFAPGAQFGPRLTIPKFAGGGAVEPVPIVVAGGEVIIPPAVVKRIGKGDLERGHQILDKWVLATREKHIKKLESLKPPKGAKND